MVQYRAVFVLKLRLRSTHISIIWHRRITSSVLIRISMRGRISSMVVGLSLVSIINHRWLHLRNHLRWWLLWKVRGWRTIGISTSTMQEDMMIIWAHRSLHGRNYMIYRVWSDLVRTQVLQPVIDLVDILYPHLIDQPSFNLICLRGYCPCVSPLIPQLWWRINHHLLKY